MRWRRRLEPCGSHHAEASVLKWETSAWLTELWGGGGGRVKLAWVRLDGRVDAVTGEIGIRIYVGVRDLDTAAPRRAAGSWNKRAMVVFAIVYCME